MKAQTLFVETITVSGAATYLSTPVNTVVMDVVSYAVRAGAGPVTATAPAWLYSNDYQPAPPGDTSPDQLTDLTKWDTYTFSSPPPVLSGAGQKFGVSVVFYEYRWARLQFVVTSGSGSILIAYSGKTA